MMWQQSLASNAKILEKLREEVKHISQSKVNAIDIEIKFQEIYQKLSELEDGKEDFSARD